LDQIGYGIRALALDPPEPLSFPDSTEVILGDVTDEEKAPSSISDVEIVIHMAALLNRINSTYYC
jgi:nucleoside-diphosphate-sugar epimerase